MLLKSFSDETEKHDISMWNSFWAMYQGKQMAGKVMHSKTATGGGRKKHKHTHTHTEISFRHMIAVLHVIIIIMVLKGWACFLFLDPQDEVGPSISSSVVLCSFILLVYIVVLVLVVCVHPLYFFWYCFISFTMFCALVFCLIHWFFSLFSFVIPSKCLKN